MCKRGDVYWAELPKVEGSKIQGGWRPIVITANDKATKFSPTFQYIPITSKIKRTDLPTHVVLTTDIFAEESMALVEQENSIDNFRLKQKIGTLSEEDMRKIDKATLVQRGINIKELYFWYIKNETKAAYC